MTRSEAFYRHAHYYLNLVQGLGREFADGAESATGAVASFDLNLPNILAAMKWCFESLDAVPPTRLLGALFIPSASSLFVLRVRPIELARLLRHSLRAAQMADNRELEISHLMDLGGTYGALNMPEVSLAYYREALEASEHESSVQQVCAALGNMAKTFRRSGQFDQAVSHYSSAYSRGVEHGNVRAQAEALNGIGILYLMDLNEPAAAADHFRRALQLITQTKDPIIEASIIGNMAIALRHLGDADGALRCYGQQLGIVKAIGDMDGEGRCLWNMAILEHEQSATALAIDMAEQALVLLESRDNPLSHRIRTVTASWKQVGGA
jgi:tetratricopeptide (TPR) repeat protein